MNIGKGQMRRVLTVNALQPVAQTDLTPENCFAPCSLRIIYPCSDSVPLDARTCLGLRTAGIGLIAAWLQARFTSSAGDPDYA